MLTILVVAMSATIRFVFLYHPVVIDSSDGYYHYHPLAWNMLEGNGLSKEREAPFLPDSFHQPGYPVFLASVYAVSGRDFQVVDKLSSGREIIGGSSVQDVGIIQSLLELATVLLVWLIGGSLGLSHRARVAAVAVGLLCPLLPRYNREILTEILATFTITLTVYTAVLVTTKEELRYWILTGIFGGIALLVRADLLPSVLFLIIVTLGRSKQWLPRGVILTIAMLLTMLPWTTRNYIQFGDVRPLGETMDQTREPYVQWLDTWLTDNSEQKEYWHNREPDPTINYARQAALNKEQYPIRTFLLVPVLRVLRVWINQPSTLPTSPKLIGLRILSYMALTLSLIGMILSVYKRRWQMLLPFSIIAGRSVLPVMSALAVEPRYMLEALPMLFIFSGYGIDTMLKFSNYNVSVPRQWGTCLHS